MLCAYPFSGQKLLKLLQTCTSSYCDILPDWLESAFEMTSVLGLPRVKLDFCVISYLRD